MKIMVSVQASAAWQRAANCSLVQEDMKRAPKQPHYTFASFVGMKLEQWH